MNSVQSSQKNTKETLVFGCDHGGFAYKEFLKKFAETKGYTIIDCGTHSPDSVDYPDYIECVVRSVLAGSVGVLICGSGVGMSIGANRFKGIRAALCMNSQMAKVAREHNNANILVLGERLMSTDEAASCLNAFLNTPFVGDRHQRRIEKLDTFPSC
ncbi:MAG: ribose 5-phosphate isomerase B [Alphaproteobacteria bacterium]|nr:ribose 5-phosphate isomerase B [Alphaproteobacteria bacterium]